MRDHMSAIHIQQTHRVIQQLNCEFQSSMSLLGISSGIPVCLTKDQYYTDNTLYSDDCYSTTNFKHENMFPPYVRLFSESDSEFEQHHNADVRGGVLSVDDKIEKTFILVGLSTLGTNEDDINVSVSKKPAVPLPEYNQCCLWSNPRVGTCGDTSHRKQIFLSRLRYV